MKKIFFIAALLCCLALVMAIADGLTGKWKGYLKTPDGNKVPITYNFIADGDKLTGTAETGEGVLNIYDGKISGNTFSFTVTGNDGDYLHKGKIYTDSCGIDIDFTDGLKAHLTIVRETTK